MTCENCIHHDVCNEHHKLMLTVDSLFELIYQYGVQYSCKSFKNKADYAEVKHGEWVETVWKIKNYSADCYGNRVPQYFCSLCQREVYSKEPYCHCGAIMDGTPQKEG